MDICCSRIARVTSLRSRTVGIICFWLLFAARGQGTSRSLLAKSFDILLNDIAENDTEIWAESNTEIRAESDTEMKVKQRTLHMYMINDNIILHIATSDMATLSYLCVCLASLGGTSPVHVQPRLS